MTEKATPRKKKAAQGLGLEGDEGRTPEEIAANISRIEAQARLFNAMADNAAAEREKNAVETQFGRENIESLKLVRTQQEIATREAQRLEAEKMSNPVYHRTYHFTQPVEARSIRACMERMDIWHREDPSCEFEIVFTSPGGSVIDGMALFDYIRQMQSKGHKVITSTLGMAASMAGILLQAGDVRAMGRESYLLIHQVSFGASGSFGEVEDEVNFVKKIQERVLDIFATRSKMPRKEIKKNWERKDWWLDSTEALKYGFVDEVR